jgi:hypothetical protein
MPVIGCGSSLTLLLYSLFSLHWSTALIFGLTLSCFLPRQFESGINLDWRPALRYHVVAQREAVVGNKDLVRSLHERMTGDAAYCYNKSMAELLGTEDRATAMCKGSEKVVLVVLFLSALLGGMELWAFRFYGDSGAAWIRHGQRVEVYRTFMSLSCWSGGVGTAFFIILVLLLCFLLFLIKAPFL